MCQISTMGTWHSPMKDRINSDHRGIIRHSNKSSIAQHLHCSKSCSNYGHLSQDLNPPTGRSHTDSYSKASAFQNFYELAIEVIELKVSSITSDPRYYTLFQHNLAKHATAFCRRKALRLCCHTPRPDHWHRGFQCLPSYGETEYIVCHRGVH